VPSRREAMMTVIRASERPLTLENRPDWCQIPRAGFFHIPKEGGEHDRHYHDSNELYLISRGRAKILNAGTEHYVKAGDIVCIRAGDEHDILEIYGDEDLELFWLYEPGAEQFGHLHRAATNAQPHPVPARPLPTDFPT
jgi:mannose-6-phosphate isomerase-like protein (cupin superfamily)